MDLNYTTNINSINGFYDSIAKIKDEFFAELKTSNASLATAIVQQTQNGNVNKNTIVSIYEKAANKQTELEKDRANIINNINELSNYKNLLEYSKATQVEGFDTITPQMSRDTVTLYNLQYLQIFCKVLGIVIIIAIFWKYFSSITGMTSLSSTMPQATSLPQAVST